MNGLNITKVETEMWVERGARAAWW